MIFGRVIPDPNTWYPTLLQIVLPCVTFTVASLMVSRFRYPHVFNQWLRRKRSRKDLLQLVFTIVVVYIFKEIAIPLLLLGFAIKTPLLAAIRRNRSAPQSFPRDEPPGGSPNGNGANAASDRAGPPTASADSTAVPAPGTGRPPNS